MAIMRNWTAILCAGLLVAGCGDPAPDEGEDVSVIDASDTSSGDVSEDVEEDAAEEDTTPDVEPDVAEDVAEDVVEEDTTPDVSGDTGGSGLTTCEEDADCDDGLTCTVDACVETGGFERACTWTVREDRCLINNVCRMPGQAHPLDACQVCDPGSPSGWSPAEDGTVCEDGDLCTDGSTCEAGVCSGGEAATCEDDNPCTDDSCDPARGCVFAAVSNATELACDDGSLCTGDDICFDGECVGHPLDCEDGNPCTDDVCEEGTGCVSTDNTASCDDGDPCTANDVCEAGACVAGPPDECDDFNQCTIDTCDSRAGCIHLPTFNPCCTGAVSVCDDGDPCTTDLCDPETADCAYENNTAPCTDGNACTTGDVCSEGICSGAPRTCDDDNTCTDDSCNINVGCVFTPAGSGSCDDGVMCTQAEMCIDGACVATDTSLCVCEPMFSDDAAKVTALSLGASEADSEALDIDGDGMNDNALGPLGSFINGPIGDAVTAGDLMLVTEFIDFGVGDFILALYNSELDPGNADCDFQTQTCDYLADRSMLDRDSCDPVVSLPANFAGGITGGGPDTVMPFSLPLSEGSTLNLTIYMVTVELVPTLSGGRVTGFTGLLAGAVTQEDLEDAILAVDPESLPLSPDALIGLLDTLARNDIDIDGDGTPEAKSISLRLTAIDGVITGATSP